MPWLLVLRCRRYDRLDARCVAHVYVKAINHNDDTTVNRVEHTTTAQNVGRCGMDSAVESGHINLFKRSPRANDVSFPSCTDTWRPRTPRQYFQSSSRIKRRTNPRTASPRHPCPWKLSLLLTVHREAFKPAPLSGLWKENNERFAWLFSPTTNSPPHLHKHDLACCRACAANISFAAMHVRVAFVTPSHGVLALGTSEKFSRLQLPPPNGSAADASVQGHVVWRIPTQVTSIVTGPLISQTDSPRILSRHVDKSLILVGPISEPNQTTSRSVGDIQCSLTVHSSAPAFQGYVSASRRRQQFLLPAARRSWLKGLAEQQV